MCDLGSRTVRTFSPILKVGIGAWEAQTRTLVRSWMHRMQSSWKKHMSSSFQRYQIAFLTAFWNGFCVNQYYHFTGTIHYPPVDSLSVLYWVTWRQVFCFPVDITLHEFILIYWCLFWTNDYTYFPWSFLTARSASSAYLYSRKANPGGFLQAYKFWVLTINCTARITCTWLSVFHLDLGNFISW